MQVDQLLAVQFQEDMTRLLQHCGRRAPGGRQTLLVSATLTPKVPAAMPQVMHCHTDAPVPGVRCRDDAPYTTSFVLPVSHWQVLPIHGAECGRQTLLILPRSCARCQPGLCRPRLSYPGHAGGSTGAACHGEEGTDLPSLKRPLIFRACFRW